VLGDGRANVEELLLAAPEHLGMLPFSLRSYLTLKREAESLYVQDPGPEAA